MKTKHLLFLCTATLFFISCKRAEIQQDKLENELKMSTKRLSPMLNYGLTDWMSTIPDATSIAQLSIPGTHDSGARIDGLITNSAKCQDLNIRNQLDIGVRFLDVRCRHINNAFAIHHGMVYQDLNFDQVLNDCYDFLNSNPSETIIMSVKKEFDDHNNNRNFDDTFSDYVHRNPEKWHLSNTIPDLGLVRGKIILVRRFECSAVMGIDATQWGDRKTFEINNNAKLKIQDDYFVPSCESKWNAVQALLEDSKSDNSNRLYINFASGYNNRALGIPYSRAGAECVNPKLLNILSNNIRSKYGIIPLDFVNEELSRKIIQMNPLLHTKLSKYVNGWNNNLRYPSPESDKQYYDMWLPKNRNKENTRLFIFIHGGLNGDKRNNESIEVINGLKAEFPDCAIATINYRNGIHIPMFQHIEDVEKALNEIISKCEEMNISNEQITLAGESLGGYFAMFVGIKGRYHKEKYKAIISYSGFAEMLPEGGSTLFKITNNAFILKLPYGTKFNRYEYSPVNWIPTEKTLPELYLFAGSNDDIISPNCILRVEEAVKKNPDPAIQSKVFRKLYDGQGHTMDTQTKLDIAKVLKQKIVYQAN